MQLVTHPGSPEGSVPLPPFRCCAPGKAIAIDCGARLALPAEARSECHRIGDEVHLPDM